MGWAVGLVLGWFFTTEHNLEFLEKCPGNLKISTGKFCGEKPTQNKSYNLSHGFLRPIFDDLKPVLSKLPKKLKFSFFAIVCMEWLEKP